MSSEPVKKKYSRAENMHQSRTAAIQCIYQHHVNPMSVDELIVDYMTHYKKEDMNETYFLKILRGAVGQLSDIDAMIVSKLSYATLDKVPWLELAILRVSLFELRVCIETPYRVVINEALEIAKEMGCVEGVGFLNGVLDAYVKELRSVEVSGKEDE